VFSWHVLISFELFGRRHGHWATVGLPAIRCLSMLLPSADVLAALLLLLSSYPLANEVLQTPS
jgi:hypothetical protein